MRNPQGKHLAANTTQTEITSQTDQNLVIPSSKTYVSEDKPTKYLSIRPITSFSVRSNMYTSIQSKVNSVTLFKNGKSIEEFVVVLLFYVHGKHLRSCRDGQLALPHFSWAGLDLLSG